MDSHEQHDQDAGSSRLTRSLPENQVPAERLLWPMKTAIFLCALIFLNGSALSQSHLKPRLNEAKRHSVLIELAGLTNSLEASPPAAPGNLSEGAPGQTPPPSFAFSARLPLYLVENRGQIDNPHVSHYVQGRDRTIYFAPDGLTFALLGDGGPTTGVQGRDPGTHAQASSRFEERPPTSRWVVKLDFVDSNSRVRAAGRQPTAAVVSYFKGPVEKRMADLPTFAELVYSDLWPGIDLVYAGEVQGLKYRFVVAPGADPDRIRLAYRGADVQLNDRGQLDVSTPFGGFQDARPVAYQEVEGERVEVAAEFGLEAEPDTGRHTFGFQLGAYDSSRPLVVDPSLVVYAGYIGGDRVDGARDVAVDAEGNVYVAGFTSSSHTSFPVAAGPDTTFNADQDAFVAKVNADGTALIYAGYIGGSGSEIANGIAVDNDGNAYVTGSTESGAASFPVTVGPNLVYGGGTTDAFVAKVNAAGTALVYAGYVGGSESDSAAGVAVDSEGHAYLAGDTLSTEASFPVRNGPDLTFNGVRDAFVTKVNPNGTALIYAGYIGGSQFDVGSAVAVDAGGHAYVAGYTGSNEETFLVAVGPDLTFNGGGQDAFIAKVGSSGGALEYAGYLGGAGFEFGRGVAVDAAGQAYVTGDTNSKEDSFPVAVGPDLTFNGGGRDAFIASVTSDGTALAYAGYIGGAGFDQANAVAVDSTGSAHVAGYTSSTEETFPVAVGPDLTFNGVRDAFVARVHSAGASLIHASYVGGEGDELGWGIAVDGDGFIYIVGETLSTEDSFPVTVGPDLTFNGLRDAFVAKLDISGPSISADGVVNAASFLSGPVAPGEIISIFGSRIGPDEGVGAQLDESGRVPTELAGTQVLFDGEPVPLFFVRTDQVNAQATYRLDGLTSTEIQIIYGGEASNVVTVPVASSAPAFFTLPDDRTQVIAILPDGSLNSTANPAQPGDVLVFYVTGEGQTVPAGEEGKLAEPPFPEPVLPVEVVIGGLPAKILYFAAAPGYAGLVQANMEIPKGLQAAALSEEGVAASNAVPIVAHLGEGQSQDNANIAVGEDGGVIGDNKPPQADGQSVMTNEDTPLPISLSGSDPDRDPLTFSIVRRPANGLLGALTQIPPTGASTTYTPKADYAGPDSLVFQVDDGRGGTARATVNITVKPLDDPPIANDDTITTGRNQPATRNVLDNDSDPDGDPLTITAVTQGSNGSVTTNGQTVTYTPNDDFTGSDSFTYTISDGNSTDTATVNVRVREGRPRADLSIDKAVTSAEFKAGQQATYTLTAINSGSADATNVTVTDTIPAPLTLVSATPSQGSPCTGSPAVTCSLGTIPAGQSATVTIVVDIPSSATGVVSNTAVVASPDDNVQSSSDTETTTIGVMADLRIEKIDNIDPVVAGQDSITYTITVTNDGPADAANVAVADTLPAGVTLVSTSGCAEDPSGVPACTLGAIAANASKQYTITVSVDSSASGTLTNTATVSAPEDAMTANNTVMETTAVQGNVDLSITKMTSGAVVAGSQISYTIIVSNNGPSDVVGAIVTDAFPAAELSNVNWTCVAAGAGSFCTPAGMGDLGETVNIGAGGSVTFMVTADLASGAVGDLVNTAMVTAPAGVTEVNPGDESDTDATPIGEDADLQIVKTPATSPVIAGGQVTYTLTVTNNGPSDATGVVVSDTIPTALIWVSDTCGAGPPAGNVLTWNAGNLANGAMAACTVTFMVPAAATGIIVNQASVSGIEADSVPGNNMVSTNNPIALDVILSVTKAVDGATPFQQGTIADYLVTVSNSGISNASNVVVTDMLDDRLTFVPAGSSPECSAISQIVTCNMGVIPPGGMFTFRIRVMIGN